MPGDTVKIVPGNWCCCVELWHEQAVGSLFSWCTAMAYAHGAVDFSPEGYAVIEEDAVVIPL